MMKVAIILVIIIGILALLGTVLIGGKGDKHYDTKTKANLSRLSWIYIYFRNWHYNRFCILFVINAELTILLNMFNCEQIKKNFFIVKNKIGYSLT